VLLRLETARTDSRYRVALSQLVGDHVLDAMEHFADLSTGESPGTASSRHLVYQLSFVHYLVVCHAFSFHA
jgi:hypothetical protein